MSQSPIARIADLKRQRVWAVAGSRMTKVLFDRAGVSPVTITAPDVLLSLQTKSLNVVYNSPYYALVTQWYSRIKYLTDLPLIYGASVLMIDKKNFGSFVKKLNLPTNYLKKLILNPVDTHGRKPVGIYWIGFAGHLTFP